MKYLLMLSFIFGISACDKIKSIVSNKKPSTPDTVLVEDGILISVAAPKGYIIDDISAKNFGLCTFYIKNDSKFDDSPAIFYVRFIPASAADSVASLIQQTSDLYKSRSDQFTLETKEDYKSNDSKLNFNVRYFLNGPSPNNFEAAGYLVYKDRILIALMSAKTDQEFKNEVKGFYNLLDNIRPYNLEIKSNSGNCIYVGPDSK